MSALRAFPNQRMKCCMRAAMLMQHSGQRRTGSQRQLGAALYCTTGARKSSAHPASAHALLTCMYSIVSSVGRSEVMLPQYLQMSKRGRGATCQQGPTPCHCGSSVACM